MKYAVHYPFPNLHIQFDVTRQNGPQQNDNCGDRLFDRHNLVPKSWLCLLLKDIKYKFYLARKERIIGEQLRERGAEFCIGGKELVEHIK